MIKGDELLDKLSNYTDDHRFKLSENWWVTLRGGQRKGQRTEPQDEATSKKLSADFKDKVVIAASAETLEEQKNTRQAD
jgi:hypothetical protein